jgi:hypothetical protein
VPDGVEYEESLSSPHMMSGNVAASSRAHPDGDREVETGRERVHSAAAVVCSDG